jgi:hypothetical protein
MCEERPEPAAHPKRPRTRRRVRAARRGSCDPHRVFSGQESQPPTAHQRFCHPHSTPTKAPCALRAFSRTKPLPHEETGVRAACAGLIEPSGRLSALDEVADERCEREHLKGTLAFDGAGRVWHRVGDPKILKDATVRTVHKLSRSTTFRQLNEVEPGEGVRGVATVLGGRGEEEDGRGAGRALRQLSFGKTP